MKKVIYPKDKYSQYYKKETLAAWVGIGAVVIGGLLLPVSGMSVSTFKMYYLALGAFSALWVYTIAENQNRQPIWLAIFSFFFPVVMLIIMGFSRKVNLVFSIDTSVDETENYEALIVYANKFIEKGRKEEAAIVYLYICENMMHNEEDEVLYQDLMKSVV